MTKIDPYIFVLWGRKYQEAPATIFVSELRQAGLKVKVVGLDGPQPAGIHGLAIVPDLTLTQAQTLVDQAICIIVPCESTRLRQLVADPRVKAFLSKANTARSLLVISRGAQRSLNDIREQSLTAINIIEYPSSDELVKFVGDLVSLLVN